MNTKILAVLAVVIIVGAGAAVVLTSQGDDDTVSHDYSGKLMIYGNANNDDYIDEEDVKTLENIIAEKEEKTQYADANCDGDVDQKDIDLVKKIISIQKGESNEKIKVNYYSTCLDKPMASNYPIKKYVAIERSAMLTMVILGVGNNMVGHSGIYDTKLFSYLPEDCKKVGSWKAVDLEAISDKNVDAVVTLDLASDVRNEAELVQNGIDVVRLPLDNKEYECGLITLGFLIQKEQRAHDYLDMCNDVFDLIEQKTAGVVKEKVLTNGGSGRIYGQESGFSVPVTFAGGIDVCTFEKNNDFRPGDEWLDDIDFTYLYGVSNAIGYKTPINGNQQIIEDLWKHYEETYKMYQPMVDHKAIIVHHDMPVVVKAAYLAENMYPGVFDDGFGDKVHQEYLDKFLEDLVKENFDVKTGIFCINYESTLAGKA